VSEVEEKDGKLWIGSVMMPFIAVYNLTWSINIRFSPVALAFTQDQLFEFSIDEITIWFFASSLYLITVS
jgi:hypothetical protein